MTDFHTRQQVTADARQQVEDGVWALTRQVEDIEADRDRWRSTAVTLAREVLAEGRALPDLESRARHIVSGYEYEQVSR